MSSANETTRDRLLAATCTLLAQSEGKPVRLSDIAKEAGVSRQALYLHFDNRTDLLIAAVRHVDATSDMDARLEESRTAATGRARLDAYVRAWADYIPVIHPVARALLLARETDEAAAAAWDDRMEAMREGCAAAVAALARDGDLRTDLEAAAATDLLWTLLHVRNWEHLHLDCGWSHDAIRREIAEAARRVLLTQPA
ncbi:TetR/AcrR family transcriptional regulator [Pontivivens ytuae]|uniref:TetR/AcrR family transcriptional regulator n=1 Tax=Pontivivens ytuae TaxID=2789856 RepID=A0A7S9LRL9_9RHOB|nr:TetR/AcrR family transcriptional regulator [Pontivivens ytuae]QPH53824.1 TetR/AcrR family transcriptional regulator [Pontivivens ytuae]